MKFTCVRCLLLCSASLRTLALASSPVSTSLKSSLKLKYFDARGAAETTRVLLALGELDYEDARYKIGPGMDAPEFKREKEDGSLKANLGRAPILIDGDIHIGQSAAIERYVARLGGLFGSSLEESALIDAVCEHVRDIATGQREKGFSMFSKKSDEEKAAARAEWFADDLPIWLKKLECCVGSPNAVGAAISLADVKIWQMLREGTEADLPEIKKACAACPNLSAIADNVAGQPQVKKWVSARPVTAF